MKSLDVFSDSMDMNLSKLWKIVEDRETWHVAVHDVAKSWTLITKQKMMTATYIYLPISLSISHSFHY